MIESFLFKALHFGPNARDMASASSNRTESLRNDKFKWTLLPMSLILLMKNSKMKFDRYSISEVDTWILVCSTHTLQPSSGRHRSDEPR